MTLLRNPPLSVYVHLPWCVRKCPYCDFNSHAIEGPVPEKRYLAALDRDLEFQTAGVRDRSVLSIFFGGGTPSLFSPDAIGEVIQSIRVRLDVAAAAEITLEANPGTVERGRFAEYRSAGVNRVSLGGQSFNDRHLKLLGRIHSAAETRAAAEELHAAGLDNFNIDLMYGLPQQSVDDALEDLHAAIALRPRHLSHYQLTLEPGTVFYHQPPPLPDDEDTWQMQLGCQEALAASGYAQYEISAYAQAGRECAHNLNYWQFGDYLGIGAGAHGKVTEADAGLISRTACLRQPRKYLESLETGSPATERCIVPPADRPFEFMLNALRLPAGFEAPLFESRTGETMDSIRQALDTGRRRGLIETQGERYFPSALGLRFLNDLQRLFLPSRSEERQRNPRPQVVNLL
ncbi:MAG TPA: radical SAM family heme chaperone HemW [Steroidobacteraceae bacterium]|nr:radical SAM family heme chaperone HemW [Steroidobacteraceae bacterium]